MDVLFKKGKSHGAYPIKLFHLDSDTDMKFPAQAMFVVPKRNFKKAHDRNKIKRRMREAYRLNKKQLYVDLGEKRKLLAFIYFSKKTEPFETIEKSIINQLKHLATR